ncbi:hypothetical protein FA13DRAFT_1802844 [Coprinellus micaceus]|uniref:Uncharacterized protein n=1 Tax=Coprinellus micaceus TaxID=71717 RepID=A0A4Y7SC84_COPMI|nr:hypothetical protein FA13DRAFT_1802844 [Coprinellus micaceus]
MSSSNENLSSSPSTPSQSDKETSDYKEYTGPVYSDEEHDSDLSLEDASDISEGELSFPLPAPDPTQESNPNPARENTKRKKDNLTENQIYEAIQKTCWFMEGQRINLPIFLDGLSWGNAQCIGDAKVKEQRTALLSIGASMTHCKWGEFDVRLKVWTIYSEEQ